MKRSKFSDEQIAYALRQVDVVAPGRRADFRPFLLWPLTLIREPVVSRDERPRAYRFTATTDPLFQPAPRFLTAIQRQNIHVVGRATALARLTASPRIGRASGLSARPALHDRNDSCSVAAMLRLRTAGPLFAARPGQPGSP